MFRNIEDFVERWKEEREKTSLTFGSIPDAALAGAVAGGGRTLGRLAWHLVESCVELPGHLGLKIQGPEIGPNGFIAAPVPSTAREIAAAYETASASVTEEVRKWRDADLTTTDSLYGMTWMKGYSLWVLVLHQCHHRGQMSVLMREAGLKPPDLFGPTREGWASYGIEPPVV